jgi:hypothetical protein
VKRTLPCCCALLLFSVTALAQQKVVKAAHVNVSYVNSIATFTIFNDSTHDIRLWTIETVAHFADGHQLMGGHTEEYGPPGTPQTKNALFAGKSVKLVDSDWPGAASVTAKITVVIYDDNTVEATDEAELTHIIEDRKNFAYTMALLSATLSAAVADAQPAVKARHDLQALLVSTDARIIKTFVTREIENIDHVEVGQEVASIKGSADSLQQVAKAHEGYANIRRLQ